MHTRTIYLFIIGVLLTACSQSQQEPEMQTAAGCLKEAEAALANDSIRQGENLLRKTIRLAEESEDWHTYYIAYQRLAVALSQSNPDEALQLMKKALTPTTSETMSSCSTMPALTPHKWLSSMRNHSTKRSDSSITHTT